MADQDQQIVEEDAEGQTIIAEMERKREEMELAAEEATEIEEDEEIEYANRLAETQDIENEQIQKQAEEINNEGQTFGRPSLIKYFILLFVLAIPNDLIDALELTGYFAVLAWFGSFFLSMTSILLSWFTDQEQKRADSYMKKLESLQATIVGSTRTVTRVAKFFRKNPTIKIIAGAAAEMILFISIFPWSSIVVILAYFDERKTYKNARGSGEDLYGQISTTSTEMV